MTAAKPTKKPTIADIAKLAAVSVATVSNALNGTGRMSARTRRRVEAAMAELGFVRDHGAAKLRTGRSKLIGVLVNDISNPFFGEFAAALEAALSARGFLPILANTGDDADRQRALLDEMLGHGVAGLVVSPTIGTQPEDFALVRDRGIPCVTCVREVEDAPFDFIGADDFSAARLGTRHLLDGGHAKIAFVGGLPGAATWHRRCDGFFSALREHGIEPDEDLIRPGPAMRAFGRTAARQLADMGHPVSAVLCFNDIVALGACIGFKEAGVLVGKDVAVVGFDNLPDSEAWTPPLTTVEVYPRSIGANAAARLLRRLDGDESHPEISRLAPRLIARQSSPPLSGA